MKHTVWTGLAILTLTGCGSRQQVDLDPAPGIDPVAGVGDGAVDTVAGVHVEARVEAWRWNPDDLRVTATPVLVHIENGGEKSIIVRYSLMSLVGGSGQDYYAMPPYDLNKAPPEVYTVRTLHYSFSGFTIAPYLRFYYPFLTPYDGPFAPDPRYERPYRNAFRRVQLPTAEMVQRALPEGVLEPKGRISGFMYFEPFSNEVTRLRFSLGIVSADGKDKLGTAVIPFVVKR